MENQIYSLSDELSLGALCKNAAYKEDQRQVIRDLQIQDDAGVTQFLAWAAVSCLLHYVLHMVLLPYLFYFSGSELQLRQKVTPGRGLCFKILWRNSKFWNCSNIHVLFLITYPNLCSSKKQVFILDMSELSKSLCIKLLLQPETVTFQILTSWSTHPIHLCMTAMRRALP